jgi:hypothetical protein
MVARWQAAWRWGAARGPTWLAGVFLLFVAARAMTGALLLHGDSREYIIQTQSLALHHRVSIATDRAREYWNRTNPYGVTLGPTRPAGPLTEAGQAGGGFGGLYPDRFGGYRYCHFWLYSLVVAPLYALLHALQPAGRLEYLAFRFVNAACLLIPFLLAWRRGRGWPLLVTTVLALVAPPVAFTEWPHPELMCFFLVFCGLWTVDARRAAFAGPLLIGAAATQNPPIVLLLGVHALLVWMRRRPRSPAAWGAWGGAYAAGLLAAFSPPFYARYYFGVWNVISYLGMASLGNSSIHRALTFFLSPFVGIVWFYSAAFLFLPACLRRRNALFIAASLAAMPAMAWVGAATTDMHAGQVGASRFAMWLTAPLVFTVLNAEWLPARLRPNLRSGLFVGAAALSLAVIVYFQEQDLLTKKIRRFASCWRARPEVARLVRAMEWFRDDPEIVVENILGAELHVPQSFNGIYVWNMADDASLWILSGRALGRTRRTAWPAARVPAYRSYPPNDLLALEDGRVVVRPERVTRWLEHPVWGPYVELRVDAAVRDLESDVPVAIRSPDRRTVDVRVPGDTHRAAPPHPPPGN